MDDIGALKKLIPADRVKTSKEALLAYSTDAGMFKVMPRAVVMVESEEDVKKVLRFSRENKIPITPRCAGSSCAGGSIGPGIILDFTRFDRILGFDSKRNEVRVQPGIIYQRLNQFLGKQGLMFAPDPASGDFCRLGGMLANNASGPQTIKYGTTKDYVSELKVHLPGGKRITAKKYRLDTKEFRDALKEDEVLKTVYSLVSKNAALLRRRAPKVKKNACGYNLFDLALGLERGEFDYTRLFVGSEGTLGIIVEATLRLVPLPKKKVTALIYLDRLNDAGDAAKRLMPLSPSAIEILEKNALDVIGRKKHDVPKAAEAMLLLEFNEGDLEGKVLEAKRMLKGLSLSRPVEVAYEKEKQDVLWRARRAALPALSGYDPKKKPMPFVEDGIVPTEKVPEYIEFLSGLFSSYNIKMGAYGHIGDGNTHIRPLMDINAKRDRELLPVIAKKIHRKIKELGGSLTGEHGDGRTNTEFLEEYFGRELYALMKRTKELFDPGYLMNPDVIVSRRRFMDDVDFEKFKWACGTCGKCNPYCPVYAVTRNEEESPRGLFRIVTSGDYSWESARHLLEQCLDCKLCKVVCPAGVDPSEAIMKEVRKHPGLRTEGFDCRGNGFAYGFIKDLAPDMVRNRLFSSGRLKSDGDIALFYGCAANALAENIPEDTIALFKAMGIDPAIPEQLCCGAIYHQSGDLECARELASFNLASLSRYEKVITVCPHCAHFIREYHKLFEKESDRRKARLLGKKVFDVSELIDAEKLNGGTRKKVAYQEPCYMRLTGNRKPSELLRKVSELVELGSACCGSSLGYPLRNRKMAEKILENRKRALSASRAEVIVTTCPFCLIQLKKGDGYEVEHLVSFLSEQME